MPRHRTVLMSARQHVAILPGIRRSQVRNPPALKESLSEWRVSHLAPTRIRQNLAGTCRSLARNPPEPKEGLSDMRIRSLEPGRNPQRAWLETAGARSGSRLN